MSNRTFRALASPQLRLYFSCLLISFAGTTMQATAQAWLVLQLTGSGGSLGFTLMLQYLPILLSGGLGGVIADRFDRRTVCMWTHTIAAVQALVLGMCVLAGVESIGLVYVLAALLGFVTAIDQPARHTIVGDLVDPEHLGNAVSLNLALVSGSKVAGPAFAGIAVAAVGVGPCFLLNAASYIPMIIALRFLRRRALPVVRNVPARGAMREALRVVGDNRELLAPLVFCGLFFCLAWEFDVLLPLMARFTFDAGPGTLGLLSAMLGIGAAGGGLLTASLAEPSNRALVISSLVFVASIATAAAAPNVGVASVGLIGAGGAGLAVGTLCNGRLQLLSPPSVRGRVIGLWNIAVAGTRAIGAPVAGFVGERAGARTALWFGAGGVLLLALPSWWLLLRGRRSTRLGRAPVPVLEQAVE